MNDASRPNTIVIGIACGTGAALCWAGGFVAARHGINVGLSPLDIVLHRFVWSALLLFPLFVGNRGADLKAVGWGRGIVLTFLGGPGLAIISYSGFLLVPLGHGGVIQPSMAALTGLLLATIVLKERLPPQRALGALVIVCGLVVIGGEALTTIGTYGLVGDLMFVTAGCFFGTFGMLLRRWRIEAMRGTVVVSVLSFVTVPIYWAVIGFGRLIAAGIVENLLQAVVQGLLAGPGAIYLFAKAVSLLGASRAAVFPSLVPVFTLLIGWLLLGEAATALQITGLAIVLIGFRLAQKG